MDFLNNIERWQEASLAIKLHAVFAIVAIILGLVVLYIMRTGTQRHKYFGRIWAMIAVFVCVSSFFINEARQFGPFSWIHALSLFTLYAVIDSVMAIRKGNVKKHMRAMKQIYLFAFVITGSFTFLPGRLMNVVFIQTPIQAIGGTESLPQLVGFAIPVLSIILVVLANSGRFFKKSS